jgi:hypothetical protein
LYGHSKQSAIICFFHGQQYIGNIGRVSCTVAKEGLARKKAAVIEGRLNPAKARKSPFFEDHPEWSKAIKQPGSYECDVTLLAALGSFLPDENYRTLRTALMMAWETGVQEEKSFS